MEKIEKMEKRRGKLMVETLLIIAVIFVATFVAELLAYYLRLFWLWFQFRTGLLSRDLYLMLKKEVEEYG